MCIVLVAWSPSRIGGSVVSTVRLDTAEGGGAPPPGSFRVPFLVRVPFWTCRGCAPTLFLVRAIVYALYTMPDTSAAVLRPRAADTPGMQRRHLADATVPPAARSPVPTPFPHGSLVCCFRTVAVPAAPLWI